MPLDLTRSLDEIATRRAELTHLAYHLDFNRFGELRRLRARRRGTALLLVIGGGVCLLFAAGWAIGWLVALPLTAVAIFVGRIIAEQRIGAESEQAFEAHRRALIDAAPIQHGLTPRVADALRTLPPDFLRGERADARALYNSLQRCLAEFAPILRTSVDEARPADVLRAQQDLVRAAETGMLTVLRRADAALTRDGMGRTHRQHAVTNQLDEITAQLERAAGFGFGTRDHGARRALDDMRDEARQISAFFTAYDTPAPSHSGIGDLDLVRLSTAIAKVVTELGVSPASILMRMDFPMHFAPTGAPNAAEYWLRVVRSVSVGVLRTGSGRAALRGLVDAVQQYAPEANLPPV